LAFETTRADAYRTDKIRIEIDTAAVVGWNNYDAARLTGSIQMPPGLILADTSAPSGLENKVAYVAFKGVHGTDSFEFAVTDCFSYGPPAAVTIDLKPPQSAFEGVPFVSLSAAQPNRTVSVMAVQADLGQPPRPGTFSLYDLLDGTTPVQVNLRHVTGSLTSISLPTSGTPSTISLSMPNTTMLERDWTSTQTWYTCCGAGRAELWMSNGPLVYRIHLTIQPPLQDQCRDGYVIQYQVNGGHTCTP
jgi:hypothetical protein